MRFDWYHNELPWQIAKIRTHVFIVEQEFYDEFDEIDNNCHQVLGFIDDEPCMTGRLFKDDDGNGHIGRIAVEKAYRGRGLGEKLLQEIERKAKELGFTKAVLGAQTRASEFYSKCGYSPYGEIFKEEYCEHVMMEKII